MLPLNQDKNASLTYKPTKQPILSSEQTKSSQDKYDSTIIIFKEVHAFKM